ncbi:vitronectin b [Nothobranchius furzeri]|uniref:Vitronectin-like n=2 Tax=Nothobranchius furzeri TaxID=105023 RepID=A0A8C6L2P4_NOTFU|nr:vitronectin-like [Nothobranchius furzeri]
MKPAVVLLGLVLLVDTTFGAEESCEGRCGSFDPQVKCQCDSMCVYYGSCCWDFSTICPKKISRGDTFEEVEDVMDVEPSSNTTLKPTVNTVAPTAPSPSAPPPSTTLGWTPPTDPDAASCSGRPFDAFLQLKNGSIYAFRGEFFFELDDKSVLPGYPKLIQDVWGISGPISAAFTRINCQGKSYIFKGKRYWRFDGDVLDEDYPRDISIGFEGIPDDVDAAFAVPAPSHRGKEKAYFFKGDKYYQYEFKNQPSHEQCIQMTRSSPSVLFTRYTDLFCDQTFEDIFTELFGGSSSSHSTGHRFISTDWYGIRGPVDATMVGKVYISTKPTASPPLARRRSKHRKRPNKRRGFHRRRYSRHVFDDLWPYSSWFDLSNEYSDLMEETAMQDQRNSPVQNVYFFIRDKYYRVALQTKQVDAADPPYPRSIAKYWLGCEHEETLNSSRAEK